MNLTRNPSDSHYAVALSVSKHGTAQALHIGHRIAAALLIVIGFLAVNASAPRTLSVDRVRSCSPSCSTETGEARLLRMMDLRETTISQTQDRRVGKSELGYEEERELSEWLRPGAYSIVLPGL